MIYERLKSVFFKLDPEFCHHQVINHLDWATMLGLHKLITYMPEEDPVEVMGLRFPNTIGLAAGMDKNAERVSAFGALGFGHVEVGTVTPLAQPGNPKKRLFRIIPACGIINRMGFNNVGCDQALENLKSAEGYWLRGGIVGINIGKNSATPIDQSVEDYRKAIRKVYDKANYIAINISCPNLKNLTDLQAEKPIQELLSAMAEERRMMLDAGRPYKPIAVKLSPDLTNDGLLRSTDIAFDNGMDGIIATNTTTDHSSVSPYQHSHEKGGLSGQPLFERSTECVRIIAEHLKGEKPIIASGGVMAGEGAVIKMQAGASLVQLYSGFIYKGPELVAECVEAVAKWRREQGR